MTFTDPSTCPDLEGKASFCDPQGALNTDAGVCTTTSIDETPTGFEGFALSDGAAGFILTTASATEYSFGITDSTASSNGVTEFLDGASIIGFKYTTFQYFKFFQLVQDECSGLVNEELSISGQTTTSLSLTWPVPSSFDLDGNTVEDYIVEQC